MQSYWLDLRSSRTAWDNTLSNFYKEYLKIKSVCSVKTAWLPAVFGNDLTINTHFKMTTDDFEQKRPCCISRMHESNLPWLLSNDAAASSSQFYGRIVGSVPEPVFHCNSGSLRRLFDSHKLLLNISESNSASELETAVRLINISRRWLQCCCNVWTRACCCLVPGVLCFCTCLCPYAYFCRIGRLTC